jgi:hypothetical protein
MSKVIKFRTRAERLEIVLDIAKKLRSYVLKNGETMDLYQDTYSFVPELKQIFNDYVKQDDELPLDFAGMLRFEEIGKDIEYVLPATTKKEPLFVIRMQNKRR